MTRGGRGALTRGGRGARAQKLRHPVPEDEAEAEADLWAQDDVEEGSTQHFRLVGGAADALGPGKGGSLGQDIQEYALSIFKRRAPAPKTLQVHLFQAAEVTWQQVARHCAREGWLLCPRSVADALHLCRDRDPRHLHRPAPRPPRLQLHAPSRPSCRVAVA